MGLSVVLGDTESMLAATSTGTLKQKLQIR